MNMLDILLGTLLFVAFYSGLRKGLFVTLASLIGLVAAVYGAVHFSHLADAALMEYLEWSEQAINLAAFGITFIIILIMFYMIGKILTNIADFAALGWINSVFGGIFNAFKYAFIVSVIFMYISASSAISGFVISKENRDESILYRPVAAIAPFILPELIREVGIFNPNKKLYPHSPFLREPPKDY